MSAASPFPSTADQFLRPLAAAVMVESRNTHVRANYVRNPHENPEAITVKAGGNPILGADGKSFTVAQVAVERRWAIGPDGEVMHKTAFVKEYLDFRLEYYEALRANGNPNAKFEGNIRLEAVPAVKDWVGFREDPNDERRLIEIGFDPNLKAGKVSDHFVDSAGEALLESRIETLTEAYHNPQQRKALTATEIAEVEAKIGTSVREPDGIASKLELLTEMHSAGSVDDATYFAQVAALTGTKPPGNPENVSRPKDHGRKPQPLLQALCQKDCRGKAGLKTHERNCKKCKVIREGGSTGETD